MIEMELKQLINITQFDQVLSEFNIEKTIIQKNYYYCDNLGELKQKRVTVRVREIEDKFKLQIKVPVSEDGALHIKKEYEMDIDSAVDFLDGKKLSSLVNDAMPDCQKIGSLTTERYISRYDNTTEICIDKSSYLGTTDYEIEIEFANEPDKGLLEKLKEFSIDFEDDCVGKYSRFITKLRGD